MKGRPFLISALTVFFLGSLFFNIPSAKASVSTDKGEAALRIGALGGSVRVEDPLSPIYKASVDIGLHDYRDDDGTYGYVNFQAEAPEGGIAASVSGEDNNVLTIASDADLKGTSLSNISFGNYLVLYYDSDNDDSMDQFPAYFLKLKNIDTAKNQITVNGELPTEGKIKIVQAVQTPKFSIDTVPFPFTWPTKIKGGGGKVLAIGPAVVFQVNDDANIGFVKVKKKRINRFDKKVKITLPYDTDVVSALGLSTSRFRIYSLTRNSMKAVKVKKVKKSQGVVTAKVKHFTIYQVVVPYKESNSVSYISSVNAKVKGKKAKIAYSLADANNDASDIKIEHRNNPSDDPDSGWKTITTKKGVKPGKKRFKWKVNKLTTGYYQVRVTPIKKIGGKKIEMIGAGSNIFYVNNGNSKASAPSGLKGTVDNDVSPPQVSLSWNASSSASSYNIYRQLRYETGGWDRDFVLIANTTSTSYTDTSIPKSFYDAAYQITAIDSAGRESKFSNKKELRLASIVLSGYGGYYGYYSG
ncbi:MAG: hypothetical protein D6734_10285 [Candidatus Schekmanbacteria bacterium]|nr:MAG: hypothetical protein D6734_10285 [Candidatus Schekmanbacteria bacterium]